MQDYSKYTMNYRVLVVLIESNYIQKYINKGSDEKSLYPYFLSTVLMNSDRNYIKEACCRMIIKFFGSNLAAGGDEDPENLAEKIEYINMVETLMQLG